MRPTYSALMIILCLINGCRHAPTALEDAPEHSLPQVEHHEAGSPPLPTTELLSPSAPRKSSGLEVGYPGAVHLLTQTVTAQIAAPAMPPMGPVAQILAASKVAASDEFKMGAHPVEHYIQVALQQNPEIRARDSRVAAFKEVIPQVTSLPDPVLSSTVWPIPSHSPQTASGRIPIGVTLAQKFPWFGKLELRGEIASREAQIALTQLAETQLKVIEDVKTLYHELYYNQQAINITKENQEFLEVFIRLANARSSVGKASQQDVLRAQVELRRLQDLLVRFARQLKVSQADLARVLSIPPKTNLRARDELPETPVPEQLDRLYQLALRARPELKGRMEAILRDRQKVELAKLDFYPDVTVGLSWSVITSDQSISPVRNGNDTVGLAFSLNLPIWKEKLHAGVREAQNREAESASLYQVARDDTYRFIRRFTVQARALEEQIKLYREPKTGIIAKSEQALRVSFADYRVDKIDALQVLDNYTQLLRFRIQLTRLEASLGQVLASLERAVGARLAEHPEKPGTLPLLKTR